jgi:hypothetical protein
MNPANYDAIQLRPRGPWHLIKTGSPTRRTYCGFNVISLNPRYPLSHIAESEPRCKLCLKIVKALDAPE